LLDFVAAKGDGSAPNDALRYAELSKGSVCRERLDRALGAASHYSIDDAWRSSAAIEQNPGVEGIPVRASGKKLTS